MKYSKIFLTFLALFLVVSSCQDNDPDAVTQTIIEFEVLNSPDEGARVAQGDAIPPCNETEIHMVFLRIILPDGSEWEGEVTPKFFPAIGRWQLQIPHTTPGNYVIEEFLVMDEDGTVIYAIPQEDSEFGFVSHTLPYEFEIRTGRKIINHLAVYCFWYGEAPLFGIKIIDFFECLVFRVWFFVNYCDESGHHLGKIKTLTAKIPGSPEPMVINGKFSDENSLWYLPLVWCFDSSQIVQISIDIVTPSGEIVTIEKRYPVEELLDEWHDRVLHLSVGCDN